MNLTEARIITYCNVHCHGKPTSLQEICRYYQDTYGTTTTNYIANACSSLANDGYLVKRSVNKGRKGGESVWYTATMVGIEQARVWLGARKLVLERREGSSSVVNWEGWLA